MGNRKTADTEAEMSWPTEQTLAEQLREMIVPPACIDLIEQAAARLDDLERDLFIEREAFKAEHYAVEQLERQLATVAQAERERIKEMVCETCRQKL
jgi:predicted transcriptional regulator